MHWFLIHAALSALTKNEWNGIDSIQSTHLSPLLSLNQTFMSFHHYDFKLDDVCIKLHHFHFDELLTFLSAQSHHQIDFSDEF